MNHLHKQQNKIGQQVLSGYKLSSHLCVFVIAVGGQKYFGYFIHAAEEKGKLRLGEGKTDIIINQQHRKNETESSVCHPSYKLKVQVGACIYV